MSNKVKEYRLRRGMSQEELSKISGIPRTTISAIELGKAMPSVDYALRLSKALGCNVEELFGEEDTVYFFESQRDGPFISARVFKRRLLYPLDQRTITVFPPDGVSEGGRLTWFSKREIPTYTFAGCDVSLQTLSYKLLNEGVRFLSIYASSEKALELLKEGYVHIGGIHFGTLEENLKKVKEYLGNGYVILKAFSWEEGVLLRDGLDVEDFKKLKDYNLLWLLREEGTGSRKLFEEIKEEFSKFSYKEVIGGHRDLALSLKNNFGDAGVGTRLFSYHYNLGFLSVKREDYCLCYREELEEDKNFLKVLKVILSKGYRDFLKGLLGYHPEVGMEKVIV